MNRSFFQHLKKLSIACLLASASFSGSAIADDFDAAVDMYQNNQRTEAVGLFQKLADKHDPRAEYALGILYQNGISVKTSPELGLRLIAESAEHGYTRAQNYLGTLYYEGTVVKQDYKTAFHWYEQAARQGDPDAEYNLSVLYA